MNSSSDEGVAPVILKTKWMKQCIEIDSIDLTILKCNDIVNEQTCVGIKTPF